MISPEIIFGLIMGYLVAWEFEKYYINRYSVLPNVAGIFFIINPYWILLPNLVRYWMWIGVILGIIALIFLLNKKTLPILMYDVTYPLYSGKTIMGIYAAIVIFKEYFETHLWTNIFWFGVIALIVLNWYIGMKYFKNNKPFKFV